MSLLVVLRSGTLKCSTSKRGAAEQQSRPPNAGGHCCRRTLREQQHQKCLVPAAPAWVLAEVDSGQAEVDSGQAEVMVRGSVPALVLA